MENMQKPIARETDIVIQEFENEVLIYDLKNHKAFCLNQTSAMVWQLCDGRRNSSQIADELSRKLRTLVSEEVVLLALDELNKNNLLENIEKSEWFFLQSNRREIIKKIGLSSIIALPLVSSLVAPSAVSAQSAAALGQSCTLGTPSTCSTANCLNNAGSGICCSAISAQANNPGYIICTNDADATAFAVRCCSGNASVSPTQLCPNVADKRYSCNPY